jgi:hypothetical protein
MRRLGKWLLGLRWLVGGEPPPPPLEVRLSVGQTYSIYALLMFLEWTPALRCPYCGAALADAVRHAADCKVDRALKLLADVLRALGDPHLQALDDVTPTTPRGPL